MPLPADPQTVKVAEELLAQFQAIFGKHPGIRPAHARGLLATGTFVPTEEAKKLSVASHFQSSVPITIRYSSQTGIPDIPDNVPDSQPRGFAIRFHLPEENGRRVHTDIISHSLPLFPVRNGEEFLAFLKAIVANDVPTFLGSHPAAAQYVTTEKKTPVDLAHEAYYGLNAFALINSEGKKTYVRYLIEPEAGTSFLSADNLKSKDADFLYAGVPTLLEKSPIAYKLKVQIAEDGDQTDDVTVYWPESRQVVELGTLKLEKTVANDAVEQKQIIYDPIPRVPGVEPSSDPMLDVRAAVYLISGRQRRST